ncbi:dynamin family protein [Saccharibacillus brassicae]|uniref:Dynamin N-terminal domain-containing protein n=1 Tax=Saccharibacillus brassicae TaxID=2583377 RepID=A0A4Y6UWA0_SACBS|nr:dynamin family protein [Saccharibacillus brassicae]QDH21999.1 hypothetical protein FFV09_14805 [Saccharibacillus brassicae]
MQDQMTNSTENDFKKIIQQFEILAWEDPVFQSYYRKRSLEILRSLEEKEFRVTVVGEFSAGKSTFLNALIGKDILPHARTETTAAITYIRNVTKDHELHNRVVVHFKDTSPQIILNLEEDNDALKKYGTVQSDIEVTKKVSHVEVYVEFRYTQEKVVFIDTPGLNGTEEGHHDLTMHEIQHAHASICLFHLRSLAHSNMELLKNLQSAQNSFLYVINFIDELRVSEGDYIQDKITSFRNQLLSHGIGERKQNDLDAKVFGVSSLKALVARDHSIPRLYHNDQRDLNSNERENLFKESGFFNFENYLWNEIILKEKNNIFYASLATAFKKVLEEMLQELNKIKNLNRFQPDIDSSQQIEMRLGRIREAASQNKDRLKDYVNSRHAQILKITKIEIKEDIENLLSAIKMETMSITFEELERLLETNTQSIRLKEKIDDLFDKYHDWLIEVFEEVYQSAIMKSKAYIPSVEINDQNKLIIETLKFEHVNYEFEQKLKKTESKISNWEDQKLKVENETESIIKESQKVKVNMDFRKKTLVLAEQQYQKAKLELGVQPPITSRTVTTTRIVERSKWNPKRWLGSSTYEVSYDTQVEDRFAYNEWQKKKDHLEEKYPTQRNELTQELHELEYRQKQIANRAGANQDSILFFQHRITQAKEALSRELNEYENIMKKAKSEFLRSEQKRINWQIENFLYTEIEPNLQETINKNIEYNAKEIQKNVLDFYERNQSETERALVLALETNNEEVAQNIHVYDHLIEQVIGLKNNLEALRMDN